MSTPRRYSSQHIATPARRLAGALAATAVITLAAPALASAGPLEDCFYRGMFQPGTLCGIAGLNDGGWHRLPGHESFYFNAVVGDSATNYGQAILDPNTPHQLDLGTQSMSHTCPSLDLCAPPDLYTFTVPLGIPVGRHQLALHGWNS